MTDEELVSLAVAAREKAHAPYSRFRVGAALLCASGAVCTGANIENAAYSPSVCAERVAFFSAVHAGERDFTAIAVAGGPADGGVSAFTAPCGVCRQVMREFCGPGFRILLTDGKEIRETTLGALLPESFSPEDLSR